jgi:hypothetical protein
MSAEVGRNSTSTEQDCLFCERQVSPFEWSHHIRTDCSEYPVEDTGVFFVGNVATAVDKFLSQRDEISIPGVSLERVSAVGCGALGCHEEDDLIRAEIEGRGTNVVCPDHLKKLLTREVSP